MTIKNYQRVLMGFGLVLGSHMALSAGSAQAAPVRRHARPAAAPAADHRRILKVNSYVEGYNRIDYSFSEAADKFQQDNDFLVNPASRRGQTHFSTSSPSTNGLSDALSSFKTGVAMAVSVPEIDPKALAVVEAIEDVNARRAQFDALPSSGDSQRSYDPAYWARAVDLAPKMLSALHNAAQAQRALSDALEAYKLQSDFARLRTLPPGSFSYLWLKDSLNLHALQNSLHNALSDPGQVGPLNTAINDMTDGNRALQRLGQADYFEKHDMTRTCQAYLDQTNDLLAAATAARQEIKPGMSNNQKGALYSPYLSAYNDLINTRNGCEVRGN